MTPSFSGHCAGGQQHVGESRGLRRVVGVLDDDELGLAQSFLHEVEIGHGRGRIGAEYPDRANRAVVQPLEDLEAPSGPAPILSVPAGIPQCRSTTARASGSLTCR